jgi:DNA polymerase-3 subunit delta'
VLVDLHLVQQQAPILLKSLEEPPESTVFVVLAEHVPPELVTIASRCVRIDFGAVPVDALVSVLVAEGVERPTAEAAADAATGRVDRARLLASDPSFGARRDMWRRVPDRLDGTGAAVAVVAAELLQMVSEAAVAPLEARQRAEARALEERVERYGERGSGRRLLEDRHRRERRRLRVDELKFGLATLEGAYRDALERSSDPAACIAAINAIEEANREVIRNPNEALLLQALLLRLSALGVVTGATPTGAR